MKRLLIPAMAVLLGCNQNSPNKEQAKVQVQSAATQIMDTVQARQDLVNIADDIHRAFMKGDVSFVEKYMSRTGIYMGTDPGEILNYDGYLSYMQKAFADPAQRVSDYTVSHRNISINGTSAIIVDQVYIPEISKKLMLRNICHSQFENGKWVVDMYAWNFVAKNEEVPKIDKAL